MRVSNSRTQACTNTVGITVYFASTGRILLPHKSVFAGCKIDKKKKRKKKKNPLQAVHHFTKSSNSHRKSMLDWLSQQYLTPGPLYIWSFLQSLLYRSHLLQVTHENECQPNDLRAKKTYELESLLQTDATVSKKTKLCIQCIQQTHTHTHTHTHTVITQSTHVQSL